MVIFFRGHGATDQEGVDLGGEFADFRLQPIVGVVVETAGLMNPQSAGAAAFPSPIFVSAASSSSGRMWAEDLSGWDASSAPTCAPSSEDTDSSDGLR